MLLIKLLLKDRTWFALLALTLIALFMSAMKWMLDHPYAISWDEAEYLTLSWLTRTRCEIRVCGLFGGRSSTWTWSARPLIGS